MTNLFKTAAISAVLFATLAAAPAASAQDSLEVKNFIGSIHWTNGPMSAKVKKNAGKTVISGRSSLTVDGGQKDIDGDDCKSTYGRFDINLFGKKKDGHFGGYKGMEDLPMLEITVPKNTKLILRDSIIFTDGSPDIGAAEIEIFHCGKITLGDIAGRLALDSRGSADVSVGDTGEIVANLKGSGDLIGGESSDVLIESHGSADVELEDLSSLEMSIHGSGDIYVGDVEGDVSIKSHGSGDTQLGKIDGQLSYSGHGSGDLDVESVNGESVILSTHGSGDIEIDDGEVIKLRASSRGSADIEFGGVAQSANLKTSGSGDIYVSRVTGLAETKSSGSGDVEIDERD